jgi:YVTN family beta-propeller protein
LTVSVVDTTTNTLSSTIEFAHSPTRVAVSPDGRRLYVTNLWSVPGPFWSFGKRYKTELTVVDTATNTVTGTIPIASAGSLAFSPDGSVVYVVGSQGLSAINTATNKVIKTIDIPDATSAMVVSPDGRTVYLAGCANLGAPTGCSGSVLAVSTGTLTLDNIIPVGDPTKNVGPDGLAVSPDGKYVYTATSAYYGLSPEDNWQLVSAISV